MSKQGAVDEKGLIVELRKRMAGVSPPLDEDDFFDVDDTLARFLKAREWKLDEAEKMLRACVEWRRLHRPLHSHCMTCLEQPGFHSMRQVGFDQTGRPVIYSSFTQCTARQNSAEDVIEHVTYLMENATKSMRADVTQWVLVIDCAGLSLSSCNPKIGHGVSQVLSDNYPERLGTVVCVNHNPLFQGVWNALRIFLHPSTTSKVHLVRSKAKVKRLFDRLFPEELSSWLQQEIRLNKKKPISRSQREFWSAPIVGTSGSSKGSDQQPLHDPRGCPSYVAEYIEGYPDQIRKASGSGEGTLHIHRPHPNIVEDLSFEGRRRLVASPPTITAASSLSRDTPRANEKAAASEDEDSGASDLDDIEIEEQFQIPANAASVQL